MENNYFFRRNIQNQSEYQHQRKKTYLLQREAKLLQEKIKHDLKVHIMQASQIRPCSLKKGYTNLLKRSAFSKPDLRKVFYN